MTKDKTAPPPAATDTPAQPTAEAGVTVPIPTTTLTYAEPVQMGDGRWSYRATDGQGNSMTVALDDDSKPKAQAALRAAFKALTGEKES